MENNKERNEMISWGVFIGSMFLGMGVGEIFGHGGIGTLIGLGVGYIASAIVESRVKDHAANKVTA